MIVNQNGLSFEINENDSTAKVIRPKICNQSIGDIFIPRYINYNSKNYSVISICEKAFKNNEKINAISFPPDSEIRTIEKKAFLNSLITSINIPKNVETIEEETFSGCYNLTTVQFSEDSELHSIRTKAFSGTSIKKFYIPSKVSNIDDDFLRNNSSLINISISPNNKHFTLYENHFLLFKSNYLLQENFDELFFTSHLIRKVKIPSFIKHICSCAFHHCQQLQELEFSIDSQLQSIGSSAFEDTKLKSIKIPRHVKKIDQRAFYNCHEFSKIEFSEDSELRLIRRKAFHNTIIKELYITSKVEELEEGWCEELDSLTNISISPENKHFKLINNNKLLVYKSDLSQDKYDKLIFVSREIKSISVPSFIKHICSSSFCNCQKLKSIEFEENSELETINDNSFSSSKIKNIKIPRHVKTIGKKSFRDCDQLASIEIPTDSELISIGKAALNKTLIQSLYIPSNLKVIGKHCFYSTTKLFNISVSQNNEHFTFFNNQFLLYKSDPSSKNYDQLIFAACNIKNNVIIPSFIERIYPDSFSHCNDLLSVEFEENSKIQIIDKYAFSESSIQKICLPKSLQKIRDAAFGWCKNLKTIEIPEDSELISIGQRAFYFSIIDKIFIPSKLEEFDPFISTLTSISVSPKNKNFCVYNNQLLLYKSDPLQKNFDKVIVALSNVKNIIIPSFIKYLYPYSFNECHNIETIEFSDDSELLSIGNYAFSNSSIENIKIPKHVKKIERYTFQKCAKLKSLDFSEDSELISIEEYVFSFSTIKKLFIPSKVIKLNKDWCNTANYLVNITVSPNNKHFTFYNNQILLYKKDETQNTYDNLIFVSRNVKEVVVPWFVKKICTNSFFNCLQLKKIEFQKNSQLVSIQNDCFSDLDVKSFCIPRSVKKIKSRAFDFCLGLRCIEFKNEEFIEDLSFFVCHNLTLLSFPNAHQVNISLIFVSPTFTLFIQNNGKVIV